MRVFYVAFLEDLELRHAFDAIRLISSPREKLKTHITIRGPYAQQYSVPKAAALVKSAKIMIRGTGHFFTARQTTVFLGVQSDALIRALYKPDYPESMPHLTIYDGPNRGFAEDLYGLFRLLNVSFEYKTNGLSPVILTAGQSNFDVRLELKESILRQFTDLDLSFPSLSALSDPERLQAIEEIALRLIERGLVDGNYAERVRLGAAHEKGRQ